jgi:hypothetical protein
MPNYEPLSGHEIFLQWSAASSWSAGTLAFGAVVDNLTRGITEFARLPRRSSHRY